MDHFVFSKEDWITEQDANLIFSNKLGCLILLSKDEKPVGFVTIFALNEKLPIEAIEQKMPIYKLLTHEVLSDTNTGILYCHCFLLLPEHRGKGLIYMLYDGLKEWLEQRGSDFTLIYADAVSAEGIRCLCRLGFEQICSFDSKGGLYQAEKTRVFNEIEKLPKTAQQ